MALKTMLVKSIAASLVVVAIVQACQSRDDEPQVIVMPAEPEQPEVVEALTEPMEPASSPSLRLSSREREQLQLISVELPLIDQELRAEVDRLITVRANYLLSQAEQDNQETGSQGTQWLAQRCIGIAKTAIQDATNQGYRQYPATAEALQYIRNPLIDAIACAEALDSIAEGQWRIQSEPVTTSFWLSTLGLFERIDVAAELPELETQEVVSHER